MALIAATVSCLLALVIGIVWIARRRCRVGVGSVLALTGVAAALLALDVGPRLIVDRTVDVCGLEGLDVRLASAPVAWQLATSGLRGEVRVPSEVVTDVVVDRFSEGPLSAPKVTLAEDTVRVDAVIEAPMGRMPVEIYVDFSVDDGELVIAADEIRVAGRVVPDGLLSGRSIDASRRGSAALQGCMEKGPDPRHRLTGVDVDPDGLVLTVAA